MKALRHLERLQLIYDIIEKGFTGSPDELASKLRISRRTLYENIEVIKEYGIEIDYCRTRKTFRILNDKSFKIVFEIVVLDKEQQRNINGGTVSLSIPCFFSARNDSTFTNDNNNF
ncbi:MAG: HTH domain-containing protein [Bacteroidales bacterium]|nr:HTH domain-containing protein [Bacteroidales bacterium]